MTLRYDSLIHAMHLSSTKNGSSTAYRKNHVFHNSILPSLPVPFNLSRWDIRYHPSKIADWSQCTVQDSSSKFSFPITVFLFDWLLMILICLSDHHHSLRCPSTDCHSLSKSIQKCKGSGCMMWIIQWLRQCDTQALFRLPGYGQAMLVPAFLWLGLYPAYFW